MRTSKRSRSPRRTQRSTRALGRVGAALALIAFVAVFALIALIAFANRDDRIAPTTVAGHSVNGLGESQDPLAPDSDALMAKNRTELAANSAEFDDDETMLVGAEDDASDDELDWGNVGDDPDWREEIALLDNESIRFQATPTVLWGADARESDRELALDSDVFDDLHCETLLNSDGAQAYPVSFDSNVAGYVATTQKDSATRDEANAATKIAQLPLETPIANAQPAVEPTGYYGPRPTAWAPGAATAGSTARALVN